MKIREKLNKVLMKLKSKFTNTHNLKNILSKIRRLRPLLIVIAVALFALGTWKIIGLNASIMPTSHVYVCDNAKNKSEFDKWISDKLEVKWVPTYIIIKDGYVIGAFEGGINEQYFSELLAYTIAYNMQFEPLPDLEISNLDGERHNVRDIFNSNEVYILELSWYDCEDCKHQDEEFTQSIYNKYSTKNIYRYYVNSSVEDVATKY